MPYISNGVIKEGRPSRPIYLIPLDTVVWVVSLFTHFFVSCCHGNTTRKGMGSGVIKTGPKRPWNSASKSEPPIGRNIKGMDSINPPGACGPAGG